MPRETRETYRRNLARTREITEDICAYMRFLAGDSPLYIHEVGNLTYIRSAEKVDEPRGLGSEKVDKNLPIAVITKAKELGLYIPEIRAGRKKVTSDKIIGIKSDLALLEPIATAISADQTYQAHRNPPAPTPLHVESEPEAPKDLNAETFRLAKQIIALSRKVNDAEALLAAARSELDEKFAEADRLGLRKNVQREVADKTSGRRL